MSSAALHAAFDLTPAVGRSLVREGTVQHLAPEGGVFVTLHLFTDCLLWASPPAIAAAAPGRLLGNFALGDVTVTDLPDTSSASLITFLNVICTHNYRIHNPVLTFATQLWSTRSASRWPTAWPHPPGRPARRWRCAQVVRATSRSGSRRSCKPSSARPPVRHNLVWWSLPQCCMYHSAPSSLLSLSRRPLT